MFDLAYYMVKREREWMGGRGGRMGGGGGNGKRMRRREREWMGAGAGMKGAGGIETGPGQEREGGGGGD